MHLFQMNDIRGDSSNEQIVINITPDQVQNKNKKAKITRDATAAAIGFLNGYHRGRLILRSVTPLTPSAVDELVRSIEQSLIEIVGLTSFRECCHTVIKEGEIVFLTRPGDRIYTIEYNLVLPTDFQVRQVLRTDPLEKIAPLLNNGRLDNTSLQSYTREFQKDVKAPERLRESDTVQFKKIKSDRNKNKSTADRILANKITHYVAAFANHKGGHIYVGVDDETYAVCGQTVGEEEKGRILEKIESAITNMVWPDEHGKPKRGEHWNIAFVSVLDEVNEEIPGLFVIVISVARCPGGVFLAVPESYEVRDGKVKEMAFERWKKRILHDAHMRDIVKFSRQNAWKEADTCTKPKSYKANTDPDEAHAQGTPVQTTNFESSSECLAIAVPEKVKPSTTKRRRMCQRIADYMEQLINDGEFDKLQDFAAKSGRIPNKFSNSDCKVAVGTMLSLGAYRRQNFSEAYEELSKISSLIGSTENIMEFQLQRLQLLTCILRADGKYNESYEVAYGGLQQMENISAGWQTAWMLNQTGVLFSILANEERHEEVRQSLKQQACTLYAKSISHASMIEKDSSHSILKSSLQRRCHLRLAMVYLGYAQIGDEASDLSVVSSDDVQAAIKHILAVEESSLKEDSLVNFNECYLYLVKSDLSYRKSQIYDHKGMFLKEGRKNLDKAEELALLHNFPGILKYSKSRRRRFSNIGWVSEREDELLAYLSDS